MLDPCVVAGLELLIAERAELVGVLAFACDLDVVAFLLVRRELVLEVVHVALFAEVVGALVRLALRLEMLGQPFDLDHLSAAAAVDEHGALSEEVHFVFGLVAVVAVGSPAVVAGVAARALAPVAQFTQASLVGVADHGLVPVLPEVQVELPEESLHHIVSDALLRRVT